MYFARAAFEFLNNTDEPASGPGTAASCQALPATPTSFTDTTLGDLLNQASVPWAFYAEGYAAAATAAASGGCAMAPTDCPASWNLYPCTYSSGDDPFEYYTSLRDDPKHIKDLSQFMQDLSGGTLPAVSFLKQYGYKGEHPGYQTTLSAGVAGTMALVNALQASPYASNTLFLLTYDEGGGYFDHVTPPPTSSVDMQGYGTRVPLVAVGPFVRVNTISHTIMEHSSIVKFIEWNWLGQKTGQLGTRDAQVNNIGSLLDPAKTGVPVPEN